MGNLYKYSDCLTCSRPCGGKLLRLRAVRVKRSAGEDKPAGLLEGGAVAAGGLAVVISGALKPFLARGEIVRVREKGASFAVVDPWDRSCTWSGLIVPTGALRPAAGSMTAFIRVTGEGARWRRQERNLGRSQETV